MSASADLPVRYLPIAEQDLLHIANFIASDSPSRAITFIDSLDARIGSLGAHPHIGRVPRHAHLKTMGYRILVVDAYLVFYMVRPMSIEIHRIVRASRDLNHLF